ncbi:MAG: hypothetical protein ACRC33_09520 [Gemmataceae bacterium]
MMDRILSLLVAVSLSMLIWLYGRSRDQETIDNVPIPVKVVVGPRQADHYTLEVAAEAQVLATFTGPPGRMRELHGMIQRHELHVVKTITVPDDKLEAAKVSDGVVVEGSDINAPLGVNVLVSDGRNRVSYTLHRLDERRFPVRFDHVREGATGPILIEPPTVLVRGPREVLQRLQTVPTVASELPSRPLHSPPGVAAIGRVEMVDKVEEREVRVTPSRVLVRVPGQLRKLYELSDVPVSFLCPPNFHFKPRFTNERDGKVTLKLTGPPRDEQPKVTAYIDMRDGKYLSGLNNEPLVVQLPAEFQLVGDPPKVSFELLPGDFNPDGLGLPAAPP